MQGTTLGGDSSRLADRLIFSGSQLGSRKRTVQLNDKPLATFIIQHFWRKPSEMADELSVFLPTWNQAFYYYGGFDFGKLEKLVDENLQKAKQLTSSEFDWNIHTSRQECLSRGVTEEIWSIERGSE